MGEGLRIDKYLWAVRLFKTRPLAAEACEKHHVLLNGAEVKPSRNIKAGDKLSLKKPPSVYSYEVLNLVHNRQPAAKVGEYLADLTPQAEKDKTEIAKMTAFVQRDRGAGRPTKKERREIEHFTNND
jgi:ribosome-associated heat shock protein Hsp15